MLLELIRAAPDPEWTQKSWNVSGFDLAEHLVSMEAKVREEFGSMPNVIEAVYHLALSTISIEARRWVRIQHPLLLWPT